MTIPPKDQLLWPAVIASLILGGGSGVGLVDRWFKYLDDQEIRERERDEMQGRIEARVAENARQNGQEWRVFTTRINHQEERIAAIEGRLGMVHPHTHGPLPLERPDFPPGR